MATHAGANAEPRRTPPWPRGRGRRLRIAPVFLAALWAAWFPGPPPAPAAPPGPLADHQGPPPSGAPAAPSDGEPIWIADPTLLDRPDTVVRVGWWTVESHGSPIKVLQYEDGRCSPFWDLDTLRSDGVRTLDLTATGTDLQSSQLGARYFSPCVTADLRYDRYDRLLYRQERDPLKGPPPPDDPLNPISGEDLSVGRDFAVRVQRFQSSFRGAPADNLRWRLNLWGLRKAGDRQLLSLSDGLLGLPARFQSQGQRIDWLTLEIEPAIEGRFGPLWLEYSRPMRSFSQDDQLALITYSPLPDPLLTGTYPLGIMPEAFSQSDELKGRWDLGDDAELYGYAYNGQTVNKFRRMRRFSDGFDLRLTDRSIENLTLTGYGKLHREINEAPPFPLPEEDAVFPIARPINYTRTAAGVKGVWRPHGRGYGLGGLALHGGYEYQWIGRDTATADSTIVHAIEVGPSVRWSAVWDTWFRYQWANLTGSVFGTASVEGGVLNTFSPSDRHRVEFGGTFTPSNDLVLNGTLGLETLTQDSMVTDIRDVRYPFTLAASYAVTPKWSLSAGYAYWADFLDETIRVDPSTLDDPAQTPMWTYTSRIATLDVGTVYALTQRVQLSGKVAFVRGHESFVRTAPGASSDPESASIATFVRVSGGLDWQLRPRIACYLRYLYADYDDLRAYYRGNAGMLLGGLVAAF